MAQVILLPGQAKGPAKYSGLLPAILFADLAITSGSVPQDFKLQPFLGASTSQNSGMLACQYKSRKMIVTLALGIIYTAGGQDRGPHAR